MKGFKKATRRLCALTLVLALMLASSFSLRAVAAPASEAVQASEAAPSPPSGFWHVFGLPSLRYHPDENYLYHTKYAYQWLFGFNKGYDSLAFLVGCFYDTLRVEFNYGGRDWLLQLWKGSYGFGVVTGGEIGLYSKNQGMPIKHYLGATPKDWVGMEFSLYHYQNKLFTRPMENTWWVTGFKPYIPKNFARDYITMETTLRFQSEGMAAAFAQALANRGFALDSQANMVLDHSYHTERYAINGSTVCFLWRLSADG